MNTSHMTFRIPPITVPSHEDAGWLRRHTNRNLYAEGPERFEPTSAVDSVRVIEPAFTGPARGFGQVRSPSGARAGWWQPGGNLLGHVVFCIAAVAATRSRSPAPCTTCLRSTGPPRPGPPVPRLPPAGLRPG